MYSNVKEIMNYTPAAAMVENYRKAREEIRQAFGLLISAKGRMKSSFGVYFDKVIPSDFREYNLEKELNKSLAMMRRNAWKGIVSKTRIKKLMNKSRSCRLDEQLERGELPELDIKSLTDMLKDLSENAGQYFNEAVKEVFERLRPRRSGYKTNSELEIGKKVILWGITEYDGYLPRFTYSGEKDIVGVDNVFHLLDGQGIAKYPGDAVTRIRKAMNENKWECETDYFAFRWYKNGNLHIEFKRADLVADLNRIGGGNRLKPE